MIAPQFNPAKPPSAAPGFFAAAARALLQDQFAHALESASHHFARLATGAKQ